MILSNTESSNVGLRSFAWGEFLGNVRFRPFMVILAFRLGRASVVAMSHSFQRHLSVSEPERPFLALGEPRLEVAVRISASEWLGGLIWFHIPNTCFHVVYLRHLLGGPRTAAGGRLPNRLNQ